MKIFTEETKDNFEEGSYEKEPIRLESEVKDGQKNWKKINDQG